MYMKSPEQFQKEEILDCLHHSYTQRMSRIKQVEPAISVHFHLNGDEVAPKTKTKPPSSTSKKELLKMVMVEFIFLPISLISSACVNGVIHLLHYHPIHLFGFLIFHTTSQVISWFSTLFAKQGVRQLLTMRLY